MQGPNGKGQTSKPKTRKGGKAKKAAPSIASSRSWRNLDTSILETAQSHNALPSFEDLVMVGANLCDYNQIAVGHGRSCQPCLHDL